MSSDKRLGFRQGAALVLRVYGFMGPMRRKFLLGVALALTEFVILFAIPVLNERLILMVSGQSDQNATFFVAMLFLLVLAFVPCVAIGKYWQGISGAYGTRELRRAMFAHVLSLGILDAQENRTGDIVTRMTGDVDRAGSVFQSYAFFSLIRFVSVVSVSLVLLLIADWRIALISFAYNGICFVIATKINPYVRRLEHDARVRISASANYLMEAVRGLPIIRVFMLQDILADKYEQNAQIIRQKRIRFRTMNGLSYGLIDLFVASAQGVAFLIGLAFGVATDGDFAAVVYTASLMGVMANATLSGSSFLLLIQPSLVAAQRVFDVFAMRPEENRETVAQPDLNGETAIDISGLSFSYPDGTQALRDVSLRIQKGEHIAFVGASGCGKTTLVKLLQALYEPTNGSIALFGKDTKTLSHADIRALSAYVPQECTVFDDSIGVNIGFGKPGAGGGEVTAAARAAGIDAFIQSLPDGYDTRIGERGSQISGGQRQRLAIARAVLKDAPILLLDEATASLDSATEREVYASLFPLIERSTTISIAHRLSTVQNADRIIVFDGGRIREEGTHAALLARGGLYRELYRNAPNGNDISAVGDI